MTERLYWADSYIRKFDAQITEIVGNKVFLDRTAFYPGGGGQPNDVGSLIINGKNIVVAEARNENNDIVHIVEDTSQLSKNAKITGEINWDLRYSYMRYHTALHTIDAVIERDYGSGFSTGGQIYSDRARLDLDMQELTKELAIEIIEKTNTEAARGHDVIAREISSEEALKIPNIARTETGIELIKRLKTVRVIEIEGLDAQADGGTHLRNTKEIGRIALAKLENKGRRNKRLEIVL